jgi:hypothetical protein
MALSTMTSNTPRNCASPQSGNAVSQFAPQSATPMVAGHESNQKGMGMIDLQERIARERLEIAKRVASFRATQEKFKREREEYFVTTLENARQENLHHGNARPPFWS